MLLPIMISSRSGRSRANSELSIRSTCAVAVNSRCRIVGSDAVEMRVTEEDFVRTIVTEFLGGPGEGATIRGGAGWR